MAGDVYVRRLITNQQLTDRLITYCGKWARHVTQYYISPRTPMLTGETRSTLTEKVQGTAGGNVSIIWYASGAAEFLEDVKSHPIHIAAIQNFTTPNTEAPFLRPNVERATPTMKEAIKEAFS
jgi:hypothetical protein